MTRQKALKEAQALWGKTAAVQMTANGARIGVHGEYLKAYLVSNATGSPKNGRYRCHACSTVETVGGDVIIRDVWHVPGGFQTQYKVGVISLGMFFTVRAEAESFEAAFALLRTEAARG